MESTGEARTVQQFQSLFGSSSSSVPKQQNHLDIPLFNSLKIGASMRQFSPNFSPENIKRSGMHLPPSSPYSQITTSQLGSQQVGSQTFKSGPSHSRSSSQPPIFSLDCLPPLSPSPYRELPATSLSDPISIDVSIDERNSSSNALPLPSPITRSNASRGSEGLPPRKGHRRSNSDIPFGFSTMIHSSPQLMPINSHGNLDGLVSGRVSLGLDAPIQSVKQELLQDGDGNNEAEGMGDRKCEGEVVDDLFTAYMNLDNIDALNLSAMEDKDMGSRASGTKTNGGDNSDNEAESSISGNRNGMQGTANDREGVKSSAGGDIAPVTRHFRSISMDSFIGNMHFGDQSPKPPPSPQNQLAQKFNVNSTDENSAKFSLDFGNGEFSAAELQKIMANEKLAEIALSDPKRAKRILANRQSAARSKERKMRYISELEHKVQTLQTEATTLSAQVTLLQRDSAALTSQNNELKFRIQAMEQQAKLRDALNEALKVEVQRLRLAAAELSGETQPSNSMVRKVSMNHQMLQLQHQQSTQPNIFRSQHQHQPQQSQPQSHEQDGSKQENR